MRDSWHDLTKWIDYNRYAFVGLLLGAVFAVWLVGCSSRTISLIEPGKQVTRQEFQIEQVQMQTKLAEQRADLDAKRQTIDKQYEQEVVAYNAEAAKFNARSEEAAARAEAGVAHLDAQDALKKQLVSLVVTEAANQAAGGLNTAGLVSLALGGLGLLGAGGLALDNRRKDKKIASVVEPPSPDPPQPATLQT